MPNLEHQKILERLRQEVIELRSQLDQIHDELEIRKCLQRYVRGLDRHDITLIRSAFWADSQIGYGIKFSGNREQFIAYGNSGHSARYEQHQHHLTSYTIDVDGDVAHAESYVVHIMRRKDGMLDVGGGRYLDRFEQRGRKWKILVREFISESRMEAPSTYDYTYLHPSHAGRWDRDDLSYVRPLPIRDVPSEQPR